MPSRRHRSEWVAVLLWVVCPALTSAHGESLAERIPLPSGYQRLPQSENGFGAWLRRQPLKPSNAQVRLFNGTLKDNQQAHHAVLDIDVGAKNLQQCADAVIRLRAEYLRTTDQEKRICFRFTNGEPVPWSKWQEGWRPAVQGRKVTWTRMTGASSDGTAFRQYLKTVFQYAGSASLAQELVPVVGFRNIEPGDVLIQPGYPGHAALVMDVAVRADGRRAFLLAQSFMPAQDIHILKNPSSTSPWYMPEGDGPLKTPEWTFPEKSLKRFGHSCHE